MLVNRLLGVANYDTMIKDEDFVEPYEEVFDGIHGY